MLYVTIYKAGQVYKAGQERHTKQLLDKWAKGKCTARVWYKRKQSLIQLQTLHQYTFSHF